MRHCLSAACLLVAACGGSPTDDGWTMRQFPVIAGLTIPELPASRDLTLAPGTSYIVRPMVVDAAGNTYRDSRIEITSSAPSVLSVHGDTLLLAHAWQGTATVRFQVEDVGVLIADSVRVIIRPLLAGSP